jgi:PilZ domain
MSHTEKRSGPRVEFSRPINVEIVAIDGTWRRPCVMLDVAAGGAKLSVTESIEGLNLKEFFLVLSATGLAFRRCELAWINGAQLGVRFLETQARKKSDAQNSGGEPPKTK